MIGPSSLSPVLPDLATPVHHGAGPDLGPLPHDDGHDHHVRRLETADVQLALDDRAVADVNHIEVAEEGLNAGGPGDLGGVCWCMVFEMVGKTANEVNQERE